MENIFAALSYIDVDVILAIVIAGLFGLFVGAIPGLTATMAVALCVPFTFFLEPIPALALMISVGASSIYAGDIPGALLRMPGTPASAAYVDDAYLLVRSGKINRVLGLGLVSSVVGGVIGTLILTLAAPSLANFALHFSSFEYMWLSLLGLSSATLIASQFITKSLLSLSLGILFSTIGFDEFTGQARLTFGLVSLYEGISFIPAMIGLFSIAGIIDYYVNRHKTLAINPQATLVNNAFNLLKGTASTLIQRKIAILRSSFIGTFIGALPGAGADIASWISYAISKKCAIKPALYGKGSEEAIIDASSSNNASLAGSWIPTLVFGIPGDSAAAIIIGVLYMKDMQPGPALFLFSPDKLYAVFIIFLLANLLLIPLALLVVNFLKKVIGVNKDILYPIILIFSIVGCYAVNNSISSIVVMLLMGVLGYVLQKNHYPISPIILGMILGPMLERNLLASCLKASGNLYAFIERPVSFLLSVVWLMLIIVQIRGMIKNFQSQKA